MNINLTYLPPSIILAVAFGVHRIKHLRLLTSHIAGPVNTLGNTPIEVAVQMGKLDVIKYLVAEQEMDINGEL